MGSSNTTSSFDSTAQDNSDMSASGDVYSTSNSSSESSSYSSSDSSPESAVISLSCCFAVDVLFFDVFDVAGVIIIGFCPSTIHADFEHCDFSTSRQLGHCFRPGTTHFELHEQVTVHLRNAALSSTFLPASCPPFPSRFRSVRGPC